MANYTLIDCAEVHGTRSEEYNVDGQPRVSVTLRCAASDAKALINDIMRNRYARMYPHRDNLFPRSCNLRFEPGQYTQDGQSMAYDNALIDVTYGVDEQGGDGEQGGSGADGWDYATEAIEPVTEFLVLNPACFQWNDQAGRDAEHLNPGEESGYQLKRARFLRTAYNIMTLPQRLVSLIGTVNDKPYYSRYLGLNFEAETLLYTSPMFRRTLTTLGTQGWTVDLLWEYNPYGWNHFFRSSPTTPPAFYRMYRADNKEIYYPYPLADQRPFLP